MKTINSKLSIIFSNKYFQYFLIISTFLIMSFVFLLESPINIWTKGESTIDSSVFRYIGLLMQRGGVPYRDTFDHKGPLIYLYNYLGAIISRDYGVCCIEFVNLFATFAIMYNIARLKCGKITSIICVFLCTPLLYECFTGGNFTEEYAMPFVALGLYIFIDYFINNRISNVRLILCGLSFGGVLLLRPNMIAVWVVFCIFVLLKTIIEKDFKSLGRFLLFFIIGALIIVIPFIIYLIINNALSKCIEYYITYNFAYSSGSFMSYKWTRWRCFVDFLSNPLMLISVVVLIYQFFAIGTIIKQNTDMAESEMKCLLTEKTFYVFYLIFMAVNILLMSVAGISAEHYALISVPVIVFPISYLCKKCENAEKNKPGMLGSGSYAVIAYILLVLALPAWLNTIHEAEWKYERQWYDNISSDTRKVTDFICEYTSEDDKITMFGNWNIVYIISNRMAATKFSFLEPTGLYDEEYFLELETNKPALILCRQEKVNDPRLNDFLNNNNYNIIYEEDDITMWGCK